MSVPFVSSPSTRALPLNTTWKLLYILYSEECHYHRENEFSAKILYNIHNLIAGSSVSHQNLLKQLVPNMQTNR